MGYSLISSRFRCGVCLILDESIGVKARAKASSIDIDGMLRFPSWSLRTACFRINQSLISSVRTISIESSLLILCTSLAKLLHALGWTGIIREKPSRRQTLTSMTCSGEQGFASSLSLRGKIHDLIVLIWINAATIASLIFIFKLSFSIVVTRSGPVFVGVLRAPAHTIVLLLHSLLCSLALHVVITKPLLMAFELVYKSYHLKIYYRPFWYPLCKCSPLHYPIGEPPFPRRRYSRILACSIRHPLLYYSVSLAF